ncbi:MAG: N-formylglutamate deformylase [Acidobacteriota bacterium]
MSLPLLLSVPHAGLGVPPRLAGRCLLTPEQIARDGDEGAREIYDLGREVREFVSTDIARCVIDMNRAEDDFRADGVVKTHTCWGERVWDEPLTAEEIRWLITSWHRPYHRRLTELGRGNVVLAVDCHTMAAVGPPIGPDPGKRRPAVCLGCGDGTAPEGWMRDLVRVFTEVFGPDVRVNDPFAGGYITRSHAREMPWVQLELARVREPAYDTQRAMVLEALRRWCELNA